MSKIISKRFTEKVIEGTAGIIPLPIIGGIIAYFSKFSILSGVLWGLGIGIVLLIVYGLGSLIWGWVDNAFDAGKRWPYVLAALLASLIISISLAFSLGESTCVDYEYDSRGSSCIERGNDGFVATDDQRWNKFWTTLPITTVVSLLIAVYVHKSRTKNDKRGS